MNGAGARQLDSERQWHHWENSSVDGLTSNSSILVWHFSRFILFMATRSCRGAHRAACTTAVAPLPESEPRTDKENTVSKEE